MTNVERLKTGRWEISIFQVLLFKNDGSIYFEGDGFIRCNDKGHISGRFILRDCNESKIKVNCEAGELIKLDDCFFFQGISAEGYFYSENVHLRPIESFNENQLSIEVFFHKITKNSSFGCVFLDVTGTLEYWDEITIPMLSKDHSRKNTKVVRDRFSDKTVINLIGKGFHLSVENAFKEVYSIKYSIKEYAKMDWYISEAIFMFTGKVPNILASSIRLNAFEIISYYSKGKADPIANYSVVGNSRVELKREWDFFIKYVEFCMRSKSENWNDITFYQYLSAKISSGSLRSASLLLCSSIEGMLDRYYPKAGKCSFSQKEVVSIIEGIKSCKISKGKIDRCVGIIKSQMLKVRPADKLYHLEKKGVLPPNFATAWGKARHSKAHGKVFDDGINQELFDEFYKVIDLFHLLLIDIINYKGEIIFYSKPNWPLISHRGKKIKQNCLEID